MLPTFHRVPTSEPVSAGFSVPAADGALRLMLIGELDLVTADSVRQVLRDAQDESPVLICDLRHVWFVDLAGLRVLIDATAHARRTGGWLTIANCPPIVPRMLRVLQLEDAVDIPLPRSSGPPFSRRPRLPAYVDPRTN